MSSKPSTTIGFERRFNHALAETHDDFLANAAGPQPPRPPNMEAIVELNRGPFLGAQPPLLHARDVLDDAVVLDVRDAHAFAAGHRPGAVNVPVSRLVVRHEVRVRAAGTAARDRRRRRGRGAARRAAPLRRSASSTSPGWREAAAPSRSSR